MFSRFQQQQSAVFSLVEAIPNFDRSSRKSTDKFLSQFFTVLDSEEQRTARIVDACQPWPPSPVDHTTPLEGR